MFHFLHEETMSRACGTQTCSRLPAHSLRHACSIHRAVLANLLLLLDLVIFLLFQLCNLVTDYINQSSSTLALTKSNEIRMQR